MKILQKHWLFILILLLAIFTHFYRLPNTLTFLEDEARDVLIVKKMVDTKSPIALGPQTSTGNMYLGPIYYYFITPALILSNFDPIGPAVLISLTALLTMYLLYRWGSEWFGRRAGLIAAFLYGVMPATVAFTRQSWNPNLAPLISLIFIYYLMRVIKDSKWSWKNILALGIFGGILIQLHYIALILLFLSAFLYLFRFRKNLRNIILGIVFAVLGFALSLMPFIIFEVKNSYPNSQAFVRYIKSEDEQTIRYLMPFKSWEYRVDLASTHLLSSLFGKGQTTGSDNLNSLTSHLFLALVALSLIFHLRSRPKDSPISPLAFIFFGSFVVLGIYQDKIHLHYLGYMFPIVYLLAGYLVSNKSRLVRYPSIIFLLASVLYSIPLTWNNISTSESIQITRSRAVANYIAQQASGTPYNVVPSRDTQLAAPFEYFLALTDNPPTIEPEEKLFIICVDKPCNQSDLDFDLIFLKGPSHPSVAEYIGHPSYNNFTKPITLVNMEHVDHGIWVAETHVNLE